ncbi:hypothetical protein EVAR_18102_1 [Eumeta japonica]|uniref:Uncharacterized protein n=1 Tax=Eumeta variegata TaxID=151549 RepID=A0A4C1VHU5_EUMVA|nr:hypothetical protein EVAR_18102_1 [Eumeta japonica]
MQPRSRSEIGSISGPESRQVEERYRDHYGNMSSVDIKFIVCPQKKPRVRGRPKAHYKRYESVRGSSDVILRREDGTIGEGSKQ